MNFASLDFLKTLTASLISVEMREINFQTNFAHLVGSSIVKNQIVKYPNCQFYIVKRMNVKW